MEVIARDPRCPMDRRAVGTRDLIEPPPPTELTLMPIRTEDDTDEATDIRTGSSSKIDQLLHLLRLTPENEKSLVFSQFTTFLDKVCLYIAWITHVLTTCPNRLQMSLIKKGQIISAACFCVSFL